MSKISYDKVFKKSIDMNCVQAKAASPVIDRPWAWR